MAAILYPYQRRWLEDQSRFKIGMFARQTGKTFTTTLEIAEDVVAAELSGGRTRWVILSRGERQAREAMDEGLKLHLKAFKQAFEFFESDFRLADNMSVKSLEVSTRGGSRVTALPANPDTARGFSANVFLDEFAFHQDSGKIWAALFPVISKPGLKLRITSTPNGKGNKFHDLMVEGEFSAPVSGSGGAPANLGQGSSAIKTPDRIWSRHIVDIHQAVKDGLPRDINFLRAALDDDLIWRQEYECDFEVESYNQFISSDLAGGAQSRELWLGDEDSPLVMGVDVARFGDDSSVFWFRKGRDGRTLPPQIFQGLDTMTLAGKIVQAANQYRADSVFVDGGGVGGGVVDACRHLGLDTVIEVNFGSRSARPDCFNKRAEMWREMKDWLSTGCLPQDPRLTHELVSLQYRFTPDQKIKLESKDDMKARGLKSPDRADALALTFAFPVARRDPVKELLQASKPYDPLSVDFGYDPYR